uniref:Polymerase-associated protein P n=1 Tax=Hefer Valley virus TaxID=3035973 RepID=A0AA49EU27_9RHAB|nr:polymerase-associated protein P [Hefer Valley virus]
MEPFQTNNLKGLYDLDKLRANLQEGMSDEEDGAIDRPPDQMNPTLTNPVIGFNKEVMLMNRELSLEEFEAGTSGDWEEDVLKIVELAESTSQVKTIYNDNPLDSREYNQEEMRDAQIVDRPVKLTINETNKVAEILLLFGIKENKDYIFEGREDGFIVIKKCNHQILKNSATKEVGRETERQGKNTTFDQIMHGLKAGIRIKKKIGKGYIRINGDNFPMTHHEIHAWCENQKDLPPSIEESIKLIFKKAKQLKALKKNLDLENVIILE